MIPSDINVINFSTSMPCAFEFYPKVQRTVHCLFLLPGLCYHSSEVRNNSLVSLQLTCLVHHRRQVRFNTGSSGDRFYHKGTLRNDTTVSMFVLARKRMLSTAFSL